MSLMFKKKAEIVSFTRDLLESFGTTDKGKETRLKNSTPLLLK